MTQIIAWDVCRECNYKIYLTTDFSGWKHWKNQKNHDYRTSCEYEVSPRDSSNSPTICNNCGEVVVYDSGGYWIHLHADADCRLYATIEAPKFAPPPQSERRYICHNCKGSYTWSGGSGTRVTCPHCSVVGITP